MNRQFSSGGKTLSDQAAQVIRKYILEKGMETGDKLPNEFQLAKLCEVSRSTIREAIKILVFEGWVEVIRGSGTYILEQKTKKPDDPLELREGLNLARKALEFFEMRLMLEPEIAALAAANATYKDCQKLHELEERMRKETIVGSSYLQSDIDFHIQITKCTKNQVVCKLMEIIVKEMPVFLEIIKNISAEQTIHHHKLIVDSITAGDTVGAKCSMIGHLNYTRKAMLEEVEKKENQ